MFSIAAVFFGRKCWEQIVPNNGKEEQDEQTLVKAEEILSNSRDSSQKVCRFCFLDESESENTIWIHPCRCSGTIQWVHQICLQTWVIKTTRTERYVCPVCSYKFRANQVLKPFSHWVWPELDLTQMQLLDILLDLWPLCTMIRDDMEPDTSTVKFICISVIQVITWRYLILTQDRIAFYRSLWTRFTASFYHFTFLDYQD